MIVTLECCRKAHPLSLLMQQQEVRRGSAAAEGHREIRLAAARLAAEEVNALIPPC